MTLPAAFRRLAWSNLAAQSAEQLALAAIPMAAVLLLGAGPAETGLLAAVQTLPFLLLSMPAGLLADRTRRRRLMAMAELVRAAALACIPALAWSGLLSIPALAVLGFLAATGTVAYSVAAPSLLPALVPRAALTLANGRLELVRSLAFTAGPALGGVLVAWCGAPPAFVAAAAISLAAALLLAGLEEPPRQAARTQTLLHGFREGVSFTWHQPLLRPILLTAIVWNLSWFVLQAVYMPYVLGTLGLSAAQAGLTLAAYGLGMVMGAAVAPRLGRLLPFGQMVAAGPFVSVAAGLAMLASLAVPGDVMPGWVMPALAFFLFGAGPILWTISQTTLRQAVTPGDMLGRVSAVLLMASYGARTLGAAVGGWVGSGYGPGACLALAAAGFGAQALVIAASPVPRLSRLPNPA